MPIKQYVDLWGNSEQYLVHLPIFIEGGLNGIVNLTCAKPRLFPDKQTIRYALIPPVFVISYRYPKVPYFYSFFLLFYIPFDYF